MSKIFGGPRALGENQKILKFFIFRKTNAKTGFLGPWKYGEEQSQEV